MSAATGLVPTPSATSGTADGASEARLTGQPGSSVPFGLVGYTRPEPPVRRVRRRRSRSCRRRSRSWPSLSMSAMSGMRDDRLRVRGVHAPAAVEHLLGPRRHTRAVGVPDVELLVEGAGHELEVPSPSRSRERRRRQDRFAARVQFVGARVLVPGDAVIGLDRESPAHVPRPRPSSRACRRTRPRRPPASRRRRCRPPRRRRRPRSRRRHLAVGGVAVEGVRRRAAGLDGVGRTGKPGSSVPSWRNARTSPSPLEKTISRCCRRRGRRARRRSTRARRAPSTWRLRPARVSLRIRVAAPKRPCGPRRCCRDCR